MKLSICMITYNHESFIEQAIESIMQQTTNFDFELIIGEDYSKDNTRKIIEKYCDKYSNIKLIDRGKNVGSTFNFIDTLDNATGEYVAMMDGDDYMLPGKLQKQVDFLDANKEVVMVGHQMNLLNETTNNITKIQSVPFTKERYSIEDFIAKGTLFANSSKMFRRSSWPKYLHNYKINYIADYYVSMHIINDKLAAFIPEVLGVYRIHQGGLMQNMKGKETFEDLNTIQLSMHDLFKGKHDHLFKRLSAYGKMMYGLDEINKKNITLGRQMLISSIKECWNFAPSRYKFFLFSFFPFLLPGKKPLSK
jgi:glycosyltransferase involved in cell wall biosynthesis